MNSNKRDNWKSISFREKWTAKIEKAMQHSKVEVVQSSSEMEHVIFLQAKSRGEYVNKIARVIFRFTKKSMIENNQDDDTWRTLTSRQATANKIEKELQLSGRPKTQRNGSEMECNVFNAAKTRTEYMVLAAKVILHIRQTPFYASARTLNDDDDKSRIDDSKS